MRQGSEWELNWRTRLQLGKAGGWPCLGERAFHIESENRRRSVLFGGVNLFFPFRQKRPQKLPPNRALVLACLVLLANMPVRCNGSP